MTRTKKTGNKFRAWLEKFIEESKSTNRELAVLFGINDALIGHYRKSIRLPGFVTLQRIKATLKEHIDLNDLFEDEYNDEWIEDKNMFSEENLSKSDD